MERKTMGSFLAALRKANGMTQKDLADKLNVSDKTVSRWERDDGAPDLSLIPVLAEIFGVTCDELLRGERKAPEERPMEDTDFSPKGEKQRRRLLKTTLSRYRMKTYLAVGISMAGLITALICNLVFLKGILGFLCGMLFFTASILMQVLCMNSAFLSVEDGDLAEEEVSRFRRTAIWLCEKSIGATIGAFGFTVPLVLVAENAYMGLGARHTLVLGLIGAGAFVLIYVVVCYFRNASFVRKGTYVLSEKEASIYHHNHKRKAVSAILLAALMLVTVLLHQAATTIWGPWSIMDGTTFDDYDSFVAYMERNVAAKPRYDYSGFGTAVEQVAPPDSVIYYDENGNEISEEEAMTHSIKDSSGNVICTYVQRNQSVVSVQYIEKEGTVLPITVYTDYDLAEARQKVAVRNVLFGCLYALEAAGVLVFYFWKRAK